MQSAIELILKLKSLVKISKNETNILGGKNEISFTLGNNASWA